MAANEIEIRSTIADYNGKWNKIDVEDELKECLGISPTDENQWMRYLFDMVFSIGVGDEKLGETLDIIANNELMTKVTITFSDNTTATIIKR